MSHLQPPGSPSLLFALNAKERLSFDKIFAQTAFPARYAYIQGRGAMKMLPSWCLILARLDS